MALGESYPSWGPYVHGLRAGLLGIELVCKMPRHAAVGVACASSLHGGWARSEFLGKCPVADFVFDVVTTKRGPRFLLASHVSQWQFTVPLNDDAEETAEVGLRTFLLCLVFDVPELLDE